MITRQKFLQCIDQNVARINRYENAGDGSGGGCDCIGLIIGAIRLAGERWPGTHGSNWSARYAMNSLGIISSAKDLFLGEVVYKSRSPGDSGYNLPAAYDDSPDRLDYYHVGVVISVNPLCITHCTSVSGGIKRDSAQGQWKYGGKLKYVDYTEETAAEEPLYQAIVTADTGNTVNLRAGPAMTRRILLEIKIGETVDVMADADGWSKVRYNGQTGFMMSKFLVRSDEKDSGLFLTRENLIALKALLQEIEKCLGGGS